MKQGHRFVDCDMHVLEPADLFDRYLEPAFRSRVTAPPCWLLPPESAGRGAGRVAGGRGIPRWLIDGSPITRDSITGQYNRTLLSRMAARTSGRVAFAIERGYDAQAQLQAMAMEGIDIAVLFPTAGLGLMGRKEMDAELSHAICRAYNDWIHDFCQLSPHQLKWAAMLPVHDCNLACAELLRAVRDKSAVGAFLRPNWVGGRYWHSSYWDPLWELLEALNVPLCFHDSTGAYSSDIEPRFGENRFMRHVASHPTEMQLALVALLVGGVFERHPSLRIGFLEAQSWWVPGVLGRIDWDMEHYGDSEAPFLRLSALEYWQRNCFSTVEGRERELGAVVDLLGGAQTLCISTDFPHFDSDFPQVASNLLANDALDRSTAEQILSGGARLYGFTDAHFRLADTGRPKLPDAQCAAPRRQGD